MAPAQLLDSELRFCAEGGEEHDTTVGGADVRAIAAGTPVRTFSWHRGQGNYPGWLWTATTSSLVGYESLLERDRLLLADFDPSVTAIASQPFWVCGLDGDERRRHVPDYLLVRNDGSPVVVDVKPVRLCTKPEVKAVLEWTGRLCAARGWRYEVFHGEQAVVMANLRFLAIGRRVAFVDPASLEALETVPATGLTLGEAEQRVSRRLNPLDVRAAALSLLWRQVWLTDLTKPLSSRSVITATTAGEPACPLAS